MQDKRTPVFIAAQKGQVGALRTLIGAGADLNAANVVSICCVNCYILFALLLLIAAYTCDISAKRCTRTCI